MKLEKKKQQHAQLNCKRYNCVMPLPHPYRLKATHVPRFLLSLSRCRNRKFLKKCHLKSVIKLRRVTCDNPHSLGSRKLISIAWLTPLELLSYAFSVFSCHSPSSIPCWKPKNVFWVSCLSVDLSRQLFSRSTTCSPSLCLYSIIVSLSLSLSFSFSSAYTQHEYQVRHEKCPLSGSAA